MKKHIVAIVGNPNCGKTTLFNALTGARQRVGNWPGVTVEKRSGFYTFENHSIEVVDLPGTYCLDVVDSDVSLDEKVARDYILKREADLIINILDASNIERNLYLTTQLLDMGVPVIVVLNMMDVAKEKGMDIDIDQLSEELGCPVLPLVASKTGNIKAFLTDINDFLDNGISVAPPMNLGEQLEQAIGVIESTLEESAVLDNPLSRRWYALKLLEGDRVPLPELTRQVVDVATQQRHIIEAAHEEDLDIILASRRYDAVGHIMASVIRERGVASHRLTESIDRVVLNRVLGFPIFLGVMYLMFMFTINVGSVFIDFFDIFTGTLLVDGLGHWLNSVGAPAWVVTLLADGVGGGIQTVSTFIPVIAFLFLFLSILEDSGYMARAAFVIDRLMRLLGLPGKAFVPMLVGFGCNVPAIMAARTLDNEKDRLLTISMAPFMSCGARLPVYALFAAAFFPESGQNVVFILYLVGILAAIFTGLILKQSILSGDSSAFIMELPNYHLPSVTQVMLRTWDRLKAFLLRAGKAIVMVVVVLNTLNAIGTDGSFGHQNTQSSMLSKIGQTITPVFAPMGMTEENWPAAVGLFTGILAKEAVVGTLDSMYGAIAASENAETQGEADFDLLAGIKEAIATIPANLSGLSGTLTDPLGVGVGDLTDLDAVAEDQAVTVSTFSVMAGLFPSHAAVIAYLLMILLYTPCVAALGAIYRETSLGWALFIAGWTFFLGYAVATVYYQLSLVSVQPGETLLWVISVILMMFIVVTLMKRMGATVLQGRMDVSPQ
ncbi:Fe(2+) transporter permease subunit FeoB [Endozoicomonas sp. SCSIO W0465]|uniref:Fe(2+) transporter permease subunit FeoB n=1 Tax=Endozoicomonas sp. SCSIO W0465 TaxID=2918516 RepID=UPI0020759178|nr:Fe(2+) transporter permease subunit FeoB [Endozoicomonas sp. SCSIO W0465]USE39319.1 Fe(2+) transporter permease subunit FeoB [Endozoicomonas sp. SCSIO W0465]